MNSSSNSQITQLGKSFGLNNQFFLIQTIMKIVQKEKICDGNTIMKAFTRKSHHNQWTHFIIYAKFHDKSSAV